MKINAIERNLSEWHSKNTYNSALNTFISFLERDSLPISEIDTPLLRKWEAWLRKKYGDGARSVSAYFACISTVHAQARMEYNNEDTGEIVIPNPFKNCPDLYTCEWDDGNVIRYNRTKTRDRRDDRAEMMVLVDPLVEGFSPSIIAVTAIPTAFLILTSATPLMRLWARM